MIHTGHRLRALTTVPAFVDRRVSACERKLLSLSSAIAPCDPTSQAKVWLASRSGILGAWQTLVGKLA